MLSSWDKVLPYHHLLLRKSNSLLVGFLVYMHTCYTSIFFPTQHPVVAVQPLESGPTLWDPKDCSTPGSSVLHCLLEFVQMHVH